MNNKYGGRSVGQASSMTAGRVESMSCGTDDGFDVGQSSTEAAASGLLPDGVYWQSGDATSKTPHTGQGWTLTTALTDVGVDDTTTRVTSTTAVISVLDVRTAFAPTNWLTQCRWKGEMSGTPYEWNGTIWVQFLVSLPINNHPAYTDGAYDIIDIPGASVLKPHLLVLTETDTTGGFMSISDSRLS